MSPRLAVAWALAALVSGAGLTVAVTGYASARAEAAREEATLNHVVQYLAEMGRPDLQAPSWALQDRPAGGLAQKITAVLAASALPASALSSVSPEAESAVGEPDLRARRSRAVLTLAPLTLPQLGAFLAEWRVREPQWTVATIDLSPQPAKETPTGGDLPLRAVISLESLYVAPAGARP